MKNLEVSAARKQKELAEANYRKLLHREMLRSDPSLKPLIEEIARLEKPNDF